MTPGDEQIAEAVRRLRAGGVVAFPTETVYGLGADALSAEAVELVYRLKGRPPRNPLIVHVADEAMAQRCAREWPRRASSLARAFWPGPLTIVVERGEAVPAIVAGGGSTVGVRCPDHPVALALLRAMGGPLVGPSANPSGRVSPTTAAHVREGLPGVPVLDGGPCRVGIESTVVSVTGVVVRVLRRGAVGAAEIARVVGERVEESIGPTSGELESPGRLESHYAPRARAELCEPREMMTRAARGGRVVAIVHGDARPGCDTIRLPGDARGYAASLYAALRAADERGPDVILIERPPAGGPDAALWDAILDRIRRATA